MYKPVTLAVLMSAVLATSAQAQTQTNPFKNPLKASAVITNSSHALNRDGSPARGDVYLMNVQPSQAHMKYIVNYKPHRASKSPSDSSLPVMVDVGMNGTPVLDQGMHGSCVTFATTGALDALLGNGDYVSPLCNLELGKTLEQDGYIWSGWDGSWGPYVLNQIEQFGIVNIADQKAKGCGGLTEYPTYSGDTGQGMKPEDFKAMSEDMFDRVYWESILDHNNSEYPNSANPFDANKVLTQVKQALTNSAANGGNERITFGVFIPVDYCSVGACGTHHKMFDSWVLSDAIAKDPNPELGGHEMVIFGYDDNAVATDDQGGTHQGLLFLRNSWGSNYGDNGNYYMSYDYFKKFVGEVQEVKLVPPPAIAPSSMKK